MALYDSLDTLKGIGSQRAKKLKSLGIKTVRDMLYYFPSYVEDRRITKKVTELTDGETLNIRRENNKKWYNRGSHKLCAKGNKYLSKYFIFAVNQKI